MRIDKYLLNNRIRLPIVLVTNVILLLPIILIIALNDYTNSESDNYIINDVVFMFYCMMPLGIIFLAEILKMFDDTCDVELDEDSREHDLRMMLFFLRIEFINIINHVIVLIFLIIYIIVQSINTDDSDTDGSDTDGETMREITGVIMMLDLIFVGLEIVLFIGKKIIGVFKLLPQEIKNTKNQVKELDEETPSEIFDETPGE